MVIKIDKLGVLVNGKRINTKSEEYYKDKLSELQSEYNVLKNKLNHIEYKMKIVECNLFLLYYINSIISLSENGVDLNRYYDDFNPFTDDGKMTDEIFKKEFEKEFKEKINSKNRL